MTNSPAKMAVRPGAMREARAVSRVVNRSPASSLRCGDRLCESRKLPERGEERLLLQRDDAAVPLRKSLCELFSGACGIAFEGETQRKDHPERRIGPGNRERLLDDRSRFSRTVFRQQAQRERVGQAGFVWALLQPLSEEHLGASIVLPRDVDPPLSQPPGRELRVTPEQLLAVALGGGKVAEAEGCVGGAAQRKAVSRIVAKDVRGGLER